MKMIKEEWKCIKESKDYQVSTLGNMRSLKKGKERILKQTINDGGYPIVNLSINGVSRIYRVHILVAETFIPNPENKPCVDHINTIRTDNKVTNLRWSTYEENNRNELTIEKRYVKVFQYSKNGTLINVFNSRKEAELETGVDHSNIAKCCEGKRKTAGGFIWKEKETD